MGARDRLPVLGLLEVHKSVGLRGHLIGKYGLGEMGSY